MTNIKHIAALLALAVLLAVCAGPAAAMNAKPENPSEVQETLMGDLVTDAMRSAMGAQVAIINAGSLAPGAPPEEINKDTLEQIVPYPGDYVVAVEISGADLLAALEKSVSALPRRNSGFLQISGISFTADLNKNGDARLSNVRIGGGALDPKATYTLAVTDFLASGGNGYTTLKNGEVLDRDELTIGSIVLNFAALTKALEKQVGGRIQIIEKSKK